MDEDLRQMSQKDLVAEVERLRRGIRQHRDSTGHELCWHHPALWGLLPEASDPLPAVPDWPDFLQGCIRYRQSLDAAAQSRSVSPCLTPNWTNDMSSTLEMAEIQVLLQNLIRAHADHDADAIVKAYAPNAVIYDLAPPLGRRGLNRDEVASWLAGWDGPIQIDAHDVDLVVNGDLALVSAFNRMRGRQGDEDQDMWYRTTICLRKTSGRWLIVCDHSSVPFYMDGSYRAAVDLKP